MNGTLLKYLNQLKKAPDTSIQTKTFQRGSLILKQSTKPHNVYIIQSGTAKAYYSNHDGKRYIFEFFGQGDIIGELENIQNSKCLANVETTSKVNTLKIPSYYFNELRKTDNEFNNLLLFELSKRLVATGRRSAIQQLNSAGFSLRKILEELNISDINPSREDMAAYLGVSVRTLDRLYNEKR